MPFCLKQTWKINCRFPVVVCKYTAYLLHVVTPPTLLTPHEHYALEDQWAGVAFSHVKNGHNSCGKRIQWLSQGSYARAHGGL